MQNATLATPIPTTQAHLYAAMFLARYNGPTRDLYGGRMRIYLDWCTHQGIDPIGGITRSHLELFARYLEDERHNGPGSVAGWLTTLRMFYRLLAVDQVIPASPAEYVRMPKVYVDETRIVGLTRTELGAFIAAARAMTPDHSALATLLGLLGLRVSEACGVQVDDFNHYDRGHRVLRLVGKGGKPATIPLPPPVFRELDRAAVDRTGPLLRMSDGVTPMHRRAAARRVQAIANAAGLDRHVHPTCSDTRSSPPPSTPASPSATSRSPPGTPTRAPPPATTVPAATSTATPSTPSPRSSPAPPEPP